MNGSLRGRSFVVVGASSGIGRAIATRASANGATLHLVGRDLERLERVGNALDGPWHAHVADALDAAFARALALEIAPVRVNLVAPGVVATGVWSDAERDGLERWASDALPVGRLGTADDLALAYLAALENPYMTGEVVTVDGGLRLL